MTPADILTDAERAALAEACDRVARAQRMARIEAAGHSAVKIVAAGAIGFLAGLLINEGRAAPDADCCRVHAAPEVVQPAPRDTWADHDRNAMHFAGCAAVAGAVTLATDNRAAGIAAGLLAGLGREEWKRRHGYANYSTPRLTMDALGSLAGAQIGRCVLHGNGVSCAWEF